MCAHVYIYIWKDVDICICAYIIQICICTLIHACTHACMHVYIYIYTHMYESCVCVCVPVHADADACFCICTPRVYAHIMCAVLCSALSVDSCVSVSLQIHPSWNSQACFHGGSARLKCVHTQKRVLSFCEVKNRAASVDVTGYYFFFWGGGGLLTISLVYYPKP